MKATRQTARERRHRRGRATTRGTAQVPRAVVFRSHRFLYLQLVDDVNHKVLTGFDTRRVQGPNPTEKARLLGRQAGEKILGLGIKSLRFDRAGYKYHGQIRALSEGLREAGLKF